MLIPSTEPERQAFGPTRERVMTEAATTLDDTMSRVEDQVDQSITSSPQSSESTQG